VRAFVRWLISADPGVRVALSCRKEDNVRRTSHVERHLRPRFTLLAVAVTALLLVGVQAASSGDVRDRPMHVEHVTLSIVPFAKRTAPARRRHLRRGSMGSSTRTTASALTSPTPPFRQCPAIGADTSCGVLVELTDTGTQLYTDSTQPPFDNVEDTLIGVVNSSGATITSLALSSNTDLFGFDGDGLCTQFPRPSGCPFGPTGYEGPGTSFSNINPGRTGGFVNFSPGLVPGQTAYFSLEEALTSATVFGGGPSPDEQGGPPNDAEQSTGCSQADPVDCATGEFWHKFDDLAVPGRGVPLAFGRTYSSTAAAKDGPLGFGWTHGYNMSLAIDPATGKVTVTQEGGAIVVFSPNGSGGYMAAPRVLARLVHNGDGSFTFIRNKDQIRFTFSAGGKLIREADLNGYASTLSYDGSGRLASVADPAGRTFTFGYTGARIASVTDPGGRVESFGYDATGNLIRATDPAGGVRSFTYDGSHRILTMTNPRGGTTTNVYDASARVISQTDPANRTTTWSYTGNAASPAGGTTLMTDPNGNVTKYVYQNLELLSETHGFGTSNAATTTIYDPATLGRTSITDANNHTTTSTYDSNGNVTSFSDGLNRTTSTTYNGFGEPLVVTDPSGVATTRTYDANGNLLTISRPLGNTATRTVTYAYADGVHPGDVTSVTDARGHVSTLGYDGQGDLIRVADPLGDTTTLQYDVLGQLTSSVSPRGNAPGSDPSQYTTRLTYDLLGRLKDKTDPLGDTTSRAYDGNGNVVSNTDGDFSMTTYVYNQDDELTTINREDITTQSFAYDGDGNQISQSDAYGQTRYAYDPLDRVSSVTDPLNRTTRFAYDGVGNQLTLTDASNRVTTNGYDAANQLTSIQYSDGRTPNVTFTYTRNGLRETMSDGTGTTTYTYDSLNRLVSQRNGAGQVVSYGYDLNGNRTSITYPNAHAVTRTYDDANRLTGITDWLAHTTAFTPDPDGNTVGVAYPNGVTSATGFDHADQLSNTAATRGATSLASFDYTRDSNGQLIRTIASGTGQGFGEAYGYNVLNQLSSVDGDLYGYDLRDNITGMAYGGGSMSYDVASQVTRYTGSGFDSPANMKYDLRGNRLNGLGPQGTIASYAYDSVNRLTQLSVKSSNSYAEQVTADTAEPYWRFGETTGATFASSVGSYTGTWSGSPALGVAGALAGDTNTAVSLNGTSQYGTVPDSSRLDKTDTFAVELWVKRGKDNTTQAIVGKPLTTTTANENYAFWFDATNKIRFEVGAGPTVNKSAKLTSRSALDKNWHHVVGTFSHGQMVLYIDGTSSGSLTAGFYAAGANAGSLDVGRAGTTSYYGGALDELAVYDDPGAMSVGAHYRKGVQPYPAAVFGDGGEPYWRLGETSGTSFASRLNTNNGTWTGSPALGVAGALLNDPDKAVSLNGTSQYGAVPDSSDLDKATGFSLEVWLKRSKGAALQAVVGKPLTTTTKSENYALWLDTANKVRFELGNGATSASVTSAGAIDTGWHHVVATFDYAGSMKLYVDGALSASATAPFTNAAVNGGQLQIGRAGSANYYGGALDELALYGGTLTPDQVAAHYARGTTLPAPPTTTSTGYGYDGDGLRASKTSGTTRNFAWDVSQTLSLLLTDGSTSYIYDDQGRPVEEVGGSGNALYYFHDQLGSTRMLTDAAGNVAATFVYMPYGALASKTGTADTPLRWAGQYQDAESGFYYLRARYYDPQTGQFITRDPLEALTQQPYSYGGDPLNTADPMGLGFGVPGIHVPGLPNPKKVASRVWNTTKHVVSTSANTVARGADWAWDQAVQTWHAVTCIAHVVGPEIGKSFAEFGPLAARFIAWESACYIAGAVLAPETGGVALVAAATVCAAAGTLEGDEIRQHLNNPPDWAR
jgi:RHS repeat-associated protein